MRRLLHREILIVSAVRYDTDANLGWLLPAGQPVVVYCAHGAEVGRNAAAELQQAGRDATYLDGGMAAWRAQNLPTRKKVSVPTNGWFTRERPKIDRIACPWPIRGLSSHVPNFSTSRQQKSSPSRSRSTACLTTSRASNSPMKENGARSIRCYESSAFKTEPLISWRPLSAAPTPHDMIWHRNAAVSLLFRWASLRTIPTTTKCLRTAW